MFDVIIVGSGPYGISLAAHARAAGLRYKLLGYPMHFWSKQMPQNMFMRTPYEFIGFSDPKDELTLLRFAAETSTELVNPLQRKIFVEYASWFAEHAGVEFTPELATSLKYDNGSFRIETETRQTLDARNVVIATGIEQHKYIPAVLKNLRTELVSHTSGYADFHAFKGHRIAVIGSGQSAWEASALLNLADADVRLIYRRDSANYAGGPDDEKYLTELGNVFYHLPIDRKREEWGHSPGSVAHFLRPYVDGKIPEQSCTEVLSAMETPDGKVQLTLSSGDVDIYDHVLSATGFRLNLDQVPFLSTELQSMIAREPENAQFPKLSAQFESNISGLFFAGPFSSHSHGPTFRFILGIKRTVSTIVPSIINQLSAKDA